MHNARCITMRHGTEHLCYLSSKEKLTKYCNCMCISPDYAVANNTCDLNSISMLSLCKSRLAKWPSAYDRISNYSLVLTVWNRWIMAPLCMLNRFDGGKYHDEIFFLAFLSQNDHRIMDTLSTASATWETMSLSNIILPHKESKSKPLTVFAKK